MPLVPRKGPQKQWTRWMVESCPLVSSSGALQSATQDLNIPAPPFCPCHPATHPWGYPTCGTLLACPVDTPAGQASALRGEQPRERLCPGRQPSLPCPTSPPRERPRPRASSSRRSAPSHPTPTLRRLQDRRQAGSRVESSARPGCASGREPRRPVASFLSCPLTVGPGFRLI